MDYPAKVIIVVVAPVALVWIMNVFETVFDTGGWRLRLVKASWDTCVFTLGVSGGIFTDPEFIRNAGGYETAMAMLFSSIVVSFGGASVIALFRSKFAPNGWVALFALLLAGFTLILPAYMAGTKWPGLKH